MQSESASSFRFWPTVGVVACIAAFFAFGELAALRVGGLLCIGGSAHTLITRSVPVGIRGRPPSFYLTGVSAVLVGLIMAGLGVLLLAYPQEVSDALASSHRHWHTYPCAPADGARLRRRTSLNALRASRRG